MAGEINSVPSAQVAIVVVPLPLQGHLNQLLHLSRLIAAHELPVHFVGTTTHSRQAKLRIEGWDPLSVSNVQFHDFTPPPFVSRSPNPNSTFPSHLQPLCEAATQLRRPVASLLRKLSSTSRRLVVIHDSLMGSVIQDIVSLPNAESYTFHTVSAFAISLYTSENIRKQIKTLTDHQSLTKDLLSFEGCFSPEFKNFIMEQHRYTELNSGRIYNTSRFIEQPILDLLEQEERKRNKNLWALGPFNPLNIKVSPDKHKCLQWLDKEPLDSVIFVSFGTTTSFSDKQILELAIGLETSEQKFIWVLREADKGEEFINEATKLVELPENYEERVKERGLVVRDWAPQLEILRHRATGGFMSHCGWNSCMESMSMGVPIAAWPMHSDQPNNAVLVTEILKVGLVVREWSRRDETVTAQEVRKVVRRLMGSKEGEEIRKRAVEMGRGIRESVEDGGVSCLEMKSFLAHITR